MEMIAENYDEIVEWLFSQEEDDDELEDYEW